MFGGLFIGIDPGKYHSILNAEREQLWVDPSIILQRNLLLPDADNLL